MTRDSVLVGTNGAVASKEIDLGPLFFQAPLTGGSKVGIPEALLTGNDRRTVTTRFDGTPVAPVDGVLDTTAKVLASLVWVAAPPCVRGEWRVPWTCRATANPPAAT